MFFCIILFYNSCINFNIFYVIFINFIILFFSAILWEGFINSIFLISRYVDFWFTLWDSPKEFLSGVKIPADAFPFVFKLLGFFSAYVLLEYY